MIARLSIFLCLIAASSAVAQAPTSRFVMQHYSLTVRGYSNSHSRDEVTVFSFVAELDGSPAVWIAERRRDNRMLRQATADHQWIDGRDCPALARGLGGIARLPPMRFAPPGPETGPPPPFHSDIFTLEGFAAKGDPALWIRRAEWSGPMTDWATALEKAVAGCWRDETVSIPGATIRPQLGARSPEVDRLAN